MVFTALQDLPFRPLQAEMVREVQRGQMQEREEAAKAVEAAALANLSRQRQVQVRVQHLFDYNTSKMHIPNLVVLPLQNIMACQEIDRDEPALLLFTLSEKAKRGHCRIRRLAS